jgi:flagellar biosynthesis GTPase FlhF
MQPEEMTLRWFTESLVREAESIAFRMSGFKPGTYRRFENAIRAVMNSPAATAECFPSLVKALEEARTYKKEELARAEAAAEAEAARAKEQAEARARIAKEKEQARIKTAREAEEARASAEEARAKEAAERARTDALPVNRVYRAHQAFAYLQMCAQAREGYAVVYISAEELHRARLASKAIEAKARQDDPNLPALTEIWDKVVRATKDMVPNSSRCKRTFDMLTEASPVSTYILQPP